MTTVEREDRAAAGGFGVGCVFVLGSRADLQSAAVCVASTTDRRERREGKEGIRVGKTGRGRGRRGIYMSGWVGWAADHWGFWEDGQVLAGPACNEQAGLGHAWGGLKNSCFSSGLLGCGLSGEVFTVS